MKRREFIKQSSLGAMALGVRSLPIIDSGNTTTITILHTNDQHSRIEPFGSGDGRNANKGGFARRAQLVKQIRKEQKNVILLDSGDIFQGTPYFNYFGGEVEFKLMSYIGYDAATIGNHDFDNGIEGFYKQLPHAKFDFVSSNYNFYNTQLQGLTKQYKIIQKDNIKVGIFGLGIELEGLVSKGLYKETKYLDPVEISQEVVSQLKKQNCDYIICLSHLGYKYSKEPNKISDVKLAEQSSGIDLILGGHTHSFLPSPQKYQNKDGKDILINQVGFAGLYLGRIDVTFKKGKADKSYAYHNMSIDASVDAWA